MLGKNKNLVGIKQTFGCNLAIACAVEGDVEGAGEGGVVLSHACESERVVDAGNIDGV